MEPEESKQLDIQIPKPPVRSGDAVSQGGKLVRKATKLIENILKNNTADDLRFKDIREVSSFLSSLAQLTRAASDLERIRLEREGSMKLAAQQLLWEFYEITEQDPVEYPKVVAAIDAIRNRHEKQTRQDLSGSYNKPLGRKQALQAVQVLCQGDEEYGPDGERLQGEDDDNDDGQD